MKKYAIIAAGGSGQRMGAATPKQFLEINGRPILWHTVKAFVEAFNEISIILVAPAAHIEQAREICSDFRSVTFVEGGTSRFQSVKNGLAAVTEPSVVFVHDAVRCLVTAELLQRCYHQAVEKGSAIPVVPVNDSLRLEENGGHQVLDRAKVRIIQTPQVFLSDVILPAFAVEENEQFTDEATVVEYSGKKVELIEGEPNNIKITRPIDLKLAAIILEERASSL